MLQSITLENFKSYQMANIPLASLTFLIGANASGKSNLLEAIRLLSWLAKGSRLDDIERTIEGGDLVIRGQLKDLFYKREESFVLGIEIDIGIETFLCLNIQIQELSSHLVINSESIVTSSGTSLYSTIGGVSDINNNVIDVVYHNFNQGLNNPQLPCSNRQAIFYQLPTSHYFNKEHTQSEMTIRGFTHSIRETLRNIVFLDPRPALMRGYHYAKDDEMKENGSNLSSVLYSICQKGEDEKQELLNFIRSLPEQDIIDIDFIRTERNDVMVRLVESFGNNQRKIDAPLLSDGTLRVLAIAATLLSVPENTFIIIEEIDNGVHPSRANNLVKQIKTIVSERNLQVLITSHNPALLDALPDESLGDVLCCYRDPKIGDSRIIKLADLDRFPELIAQGTLGQLMTNMILDRFLKDDSTLEQRQQKALAWLTQLKTGETAQ